MGATVMVSPPENAVSTIVVRSKDGKVAAIGVRPVGGAVTIQAWVGKEFEGSRVVNP
jgi:hypothetical protein